MDAVTESFAEGYERASGKSSSRDTFTESLKFDGEYWRYQGQLYVSRYAAAIVKDINESGLSPGAKEAFKVLVTTYFDKDIILANFSEDEIEIKTLELKRDLLIAKLGMIQNDILIPEYSRFSNSITNTFEAVITRATGKDRERSLQLAGSGADHRGKEPEQTRGWGIMNLLPGR